jgi:hypothetical protein
LITRLEARDRAAAGREFFVGENDYGPPPENPAVPSGPGFRATREPIKPDYGP